MKRLMQESQVDFLSCSNSSIKGMDLFNKKTISSLSNLNNYEFDELRQFLRLSKNIEKNNNNTGAEKFPGEMLTPKRLFVKLDDDFSKLLVEFYNTAYNQQYKFRLPFEFGKEGSIIVRTNADQFGRIQIGSEIFGSTMSSRHLKSSFILTNFINLDNTVDKYPGQIQFFIKHIIDLPEGSTAHYLAYVQWYKPAPNNKIRFHFSINDDKICNVELWETNFYPTSRDCIIPIQNILCRFVPSFYHVTNKINAKKYMAINPINRHFHL